MASSEEMLAAETENHLYQEVSLRISAEENVSSGEVRGARLLGFVKTSRDVDLAALERLWKRGRQAGADVDNPTAWVEERRGHYRGR